MAAKRGKTVEVEERYFRFMGSLLGEDPRDKSQLSRMYTKVKDLTILGFNSFSKKGKRNFYDRAIKYFFDMEIWKNFSIKWYC